MQIYNLVVQVNFVSSSRTSVFDCKTSFMLVSKLQRVDAVLELARGKRAGQLGFWFTKNSALPIVR
jgi:hypothetical protein